MINKQLLKSYIKIYHLHKDSVLKQFKNLINSNLENLLNKERILGSDYLQKMPEEFQINQLHYNNLIIEFSYFENGELFNNISNDLEIYNINTESIPRKKEITNTNDKNDLKLEKSEKKKVKTTMEELRDKKKRKTPPRNFYSFKKIKNQK